MSEYMPTQTSNIMPDKMTDWLWWYRFDRMLVHWRHSKANCLLMLGKLWFGLEHDDVYQHEGEFDLTKNVLFPWTNCDHYLANSVSIDYAWNKHGSFCVKWIRCDFSLQHFFFGLKNRDLSCHQLARLLSHRKYSLVI